MKNFTSRKAIVYLTLAAVVSTMMAVNTVVAATSVLTPNQPPASTDYVSPTFTNLNVGSPATGDDTGNLTVKGKTTIGNFTLRGGDGWEPFLTFGNDGWSFDAAKFAEVQAAIESGDPSSELQNLADSWASGEVMPFGLISNPNGLLLQAAKELKLSELTGSSDALSGLNGGILALLPKFGTFDLNGTAIGISDVAFLGNTKAYVVAANVTSSEDPPGIVILGGDLVRIMAPVDMSEALNVGDLLESDPNTGVTAINAFTIDAIYPIGRTGTQSAPKDPEASLIIRSSGGVNEESRDSSWMGFSGTTILSNAQKYFKIIPYNGLRTVLIGETTSSGAINTAADKKYNFSVTGDANVAGVLTVGTLSLTNLTVANDATVNGNLNVTSATPGKGKITTKDLVVNGTFSPTNLAVGNNATVQNDLTVGTPTGGPGGTPSGRFNVAGSATVGTTLGVAGNTTVGGTLDVTGKTTTQDLTVKGTFSPNSLNVTTSATVGTTLNVNGATTLAGLSAGTSTLSSLGVSNAATVGTTLVVTGATTLNSSATVNGTLKSNVIEQASGSILALQYGGGTKNTWMKMFDGSIEFNPGSDGNGVKILGGSLGNLEVQGAIKNFSTTTDMSGTYGNPVTVTDPEGLNVTQGTLAVANALTVGTTLSVLNGLTTLKDLTVTGNTTLSGTLGVTGKLTVDGNAIVKGELASTSSPSSTSGLTINDNIKLDGDLDFTNVLSYLGASISGISTIDPVSGKDLYIRNYNNNARVTLRNTGGLEFSGTSVSVNSKLSVTSAAVSATAKLTAPSIGKYELYTPSGWSSTNSGDVSETTSKACNKDYSSGVLISCGAQGFLCSPNCDPNGSISGDYFQIYSIVPNLTSKTCTVRGKNLSSGLAYLKAQAICFFPDR